MLSQIVRPMVRTQIRILATSRATRSTLISTIAQWLGFLGVHAQVMRLDAVADRIQVSLSVGKPEGCDAQDWEQIIGNLEPQPETACLLPLTPAMMTPQQQSKVQRLLAYVIQVGSPDRPIVWDTLYPQLVALGLEESIVLGIRAALKVPQSLDQLIEGLDADVAAIALPRAVSISLLDRRVNASETHALSTLLQAIRQPVASGAEASR